MILTLKDELRILLVQEEKLWQQRAKTASLKDGDQYSIFFHSRASHRFRRNEILKLQRDDGSWCEGEHQIATLFVNYFTSLFRLDVPDINNMDGVLVTTSWVVTSEMNQYLLAEFTKIEVDVALKQMSPLKAPGPDGLPPIFYQHYLDKIGGDVAKSVLTWLNSGTICPSFNHTYITLIPKVKCPQKVMEFRPIALCNILYKLVSKVLANRLKKLLLDIISESQSAFQSDEATLTIFLWLLNLSII